MTTKITVPDIGDFENVEIIEVLVKAGDTVNKNDPIVTLESDKSSVEVPTPYIGKISSVEVKIGDKVSKGSVLAVVVMCFALSAISLSLVKIIQPPPVEIILLPLKLKIEHLLVVPICFLL